MLVGLLIGRLRVKVVLAGPKIFSDRAAADGVGSFAELVRFEHEDAGHSAGRPVIRPRPRRRDRPHLSTSREDSHLGQIHSTGSSGLLGAAQAQRGLRSVSRRPAQAA